MKFPITKLDEQQIENLSVSAIDDVSLSELTNNDILSYKSGEWVNTSTISNGSASASQTTLQLRTDTSDNWTLHNPILSLGELGYELNTGLFKFGDGLTNWISLPHHKQFISTGVLHSDPIINEHNDYINGLYATIDVEQLKVVLFDNPTFNGIPLSYNVSGLSGIPLFNNTINYLIVSYNGGNPLISITINVDDINESDVIPIDSMLVSNGVVHRAHWDRIAEGLPNKLHRRLVKTQRYAYESGLELIVENSNIKVAHGVVWRGARDFHLLDCNSTLEDSYWFLFSHISPTSWTSTVSTNTTFNDTKYDDFNLGLTSLPKNLPFNINWIFRGIEDHEHIYIVLSNTGYKDLPTAIAVNKVPVIPIDISSHAILVGRLICEQGVGVRLVESAFEVTFSGILLNEHNDLGGKQGGTSDEYYHLSESNYNNLSGLIPTWDGIQFNTTPAISGHTAGLLHYDSVSDTLEIDRVKEGVRLQLGEELQTPKIYNQTGSIILNGTVVYISGAEGGKPLVAPASCLDELSSSKVIGMATCDILPGGNEYGYVTTQGIVNGLNTEALSGGTIIWLGENGNFVVDRPQAPNHSVYIGMIIKSHGVDGSIYVNPINGFDVSELHDVLITDPKNNDLLTWDSSLNIFKNSDILSGKQPYHGFVDRFTSTLSFNNELTTFTISGNYSVYFNGILYNFSTPSSINLSTSPEWGDGVASPLAQWFIWIYPNGTLGCSKVPWDILNLSITTVATVWIQSGEVSGFRGIIGEERHGAYRNLIWHKHTHSNYGTAYTSGYTTTPSFLNNNTFSFAGGIISDEDIIHNRTSTQTLCEVGYSKITAVPSGGFIRKMFFDPLNSGFIKINPINSRVYYDNDGVLEELDISNKYIIYWIYATNRINNSIVSIMGENLYNSVALAQAAPYPTLYGLAVAEWKLLYKVIIQGNPNGFSVNSVTSLYKTSSGPTILSSSPDTITATNVSIITSAEISSTNVQTALEELALEKVSKTFTINNNPMSGTALTTTELLPTQSGETMGYVLTSNGTSATWQSSSGSPSSGGETISSFLLMGA